MGLYHTYAILRPVHSMGLVGHRFGLLSCMLQCTHNGETAPVVTARMYADSQHVLFIQIPGVTVPISHLPLLVLALVANQFIHELGHALTAAL